jgi:hypothetical protein
VQETAKALVIAGGVGRIVKDNIAEPDPVPLAAVIFTLAITAIPRLPVDSGMPEINPVVELTLKPCGSPVAPKLLGL